MDHSLSLAPARRVTLARLSAFGGKADISPRLLKSGTLHACAPWSIIWMLGIVKVSTVSESCSPRPLRTFGSAMLIIGAALGVFATPFAGQCVFADSVEPGTAEAELETSALCNHEDNAVRSDRGGCRPAVQWKGRPSRHCKVTSHGSGRISVVVCFKVLVFDPKTTVPPITAAIAPIMTVGSKPTAPMIIAKIKVPPAAIAAFEIRMIFRQLCMTAVSSSM